MTTCPDCGRPRMVDLFCCAGGASTGYHRAGFCMTGVDIAPQPNYPYRFIQADALDLLADQSFLGQFAAIAASPTCQGRARVTDWRGDRNSHPDTLTPTLDALARTQIPWIVENVPEAATMGDLRADYLLCGTQFGLNIRRHRVFQAGNWSSYDLMPRCQCYRNPRIVPFEHKDERAFADAMGCTWMTNLEGRQAIPPAMTEYIGGHLLAHLTEAAA